MFLCSCRFLFSLASQLGVYQSEVAGAMTAVTDGLRPDLDGREFAEAWSVCYKRVRAVYSLRHDGCSNARPDGVVPNSADRIEQRE